MSLNPLMTDVRASGENSFDVVELSEHADAAAFLLKALSNKNRLMILCSLSTGELSVGEIQTRVPLSQSALSQHLARLRNENLVKTRRESQTIFYSLSDGRVSRLIGVLHEIFCED